MAAVSIVTVTVGVSSMGDISGCIVSSTSTEVVSSAEGPSSGRVVVISSHEVPGVQGGGILTSTGGPPVDSPVGGSVAAGLFILTLEGDPLGGGTETKVCSGLLVEGGGQGAGVSTRRTCN